MSTLRTMAVVAVGVGILFALGVGVVLPTLSTVQPSEETQTFLQEEGAEVQVTSELTSTAVNVNKDPSRNATLRLTDTRTGEQLTREISQVGDPYTYQFVGYSVTVEVTQIQNEQNLRVQYTYDESDFRPDGYERSVTTLGVFTMVILLVMGVGLLREAV